jgi:hypothetical protein
MLIATIKDQKELPRKIKNILDTAKKRSETAITIMTDRSWHMEVFDFLLKNKNVGRVRIGDDTVFVVKEMRIEIVPIDYYV